jgi:hypothetical protein
MDEPSAAWQAAAVVECFLVDFLVVAEAPPASVVEEGGL